MGGWQVVSEMATAVGLVLFGACTVWGAFTQNPGLNVVLLVPGGVAAVAVVGEWLWVECVCL